MAPEIVQQINKTKIKVTTKADIWSLGCLIFELFTGVPPYQGRNDVETINNIVT